MWRTPFRQLNKKDWCVLALSLTLVMLCNVLTPSATLTTKVGVVVGAIALILMAKGDVWGQILTVVFSVLYGITSWQFRYYGEMITYLGMTLPMAVAAVFSWLRHPFEGNMAQVEIHRLTCRQQWGMVICCVPVTVIFGIILWWLHTPNLLFSTISVTTSFLAAYLTYFRSSYYALAYAANDIVLIILWVLASVKDISFAPMVACFLVFLANDLYAFSSWNNRETVQYTYTHNKRK